MTTKTPPLGFTEDNFCAVVRASDPQAKGIKTETRRLSHGNDKPKYNIGDRCYLTEPTRIVLAPDQSFYYQVEYFWYDPKTIQKLVTNDDIAKILGRKSGIDSKQIARFMLKSFARYSVEITDVRLERLLDITEEAAIAEGIKSINLSCNPLYLDYMKGDEYVADPIQSYLSEIAAIHKPTKDKIGGWDLVKSNPWVWVYQFKLVTEQS